jgi:hypothetical protein
LNHTPNFDELPLGDQIKQVIAQLPTSTVSLGEILELVGRDGMLLLVAFLTLVFMVPVSIPGVSTIFGAAILLIGISRIFGRTLWLPKRFKERALPADKLRSALEKGLVWIPRLEKISKPHRMAWLTAGPRHEHHQRWRFDSGRHTADGTIRLYSVLQHRAGHCPVVSCRGA